MISIAQSDPCKQDRRLEDSAVGLKDAATLKDRERDTTTLDGRM